MTGERITGRLSEVAEAIAGRTIAEATMEHDEIAMRFTDGTWLYVLYDAGEEDVDAYTTIDPPAYTLLDIGVVAPDEAMAMHKDQNEKDAAAAEAAERAELERLKKKYEATSAPREGDAAPAPSPTPPSIRISRTLGGAIPLPVCPSCGRAVASMDELGGRDGVCKSCEGAAGR